MPSSHPLDLLVLTKGGPGFPSSRFRAFQFEPLFRQDGYSVHMQKVPSRLMDRLRLYWRHRGSRVLLIQKRFFNPLERWWLRRLYPRIAYDFDDAMGVPTSNKKENKWHLRKRAGQLRAMCRFADQVICCNDVLRELSGRPDAVLIPTSYELPEERPKMKDFSTIRLLWIGMDMTKLDIWQYAQQELAQDERVSLAISSHKDNPPELPFEFEYRKWDLDVEAELLEWANVGVMPLPDDANSRGKCGFKLIQYLAHGLIPVASDVGFNSEILENGVDGFLCRTEESAVAAVKQIMDGQVDTGSLVDKGWEKANTFSVQQIYRKLVGTLLNTDSTS